MQKMDEYVFDLLLVMFSQKTNYFLLVTHILFYFYPYPLNFLCLSNSENKQPCSVKLRMSAVIICGF